MTSFEKTLVEDKEKLKKNEQGELSLFKAQIYLEMGNLQKSIDILNDKNSMIVNQVKKGETLARAYGL